MPKIKSGNDLKFNNAQTDLTSNDVQGAIVEVANKVTTVTTTTQEGWRDLTSEIVVRGNLASAPSWDQIGESEFYAYNFGIGKEGWAPFHINHDYKPGGTILFHIHWTTDGTSTNVVKWQVDYTVAKGHNQSSGGNFLTSGAQIFLQQAASGSAFRHMVTEMSSTIILTNAEPDALILVHFKRVTNGGTDNSDKVFGLTVDMHYEADRFATINRSPNFYA